MEKLKLENDIRVFGKPVPSFPQGIKEAFDELVELVPNALKRSYFGLSHLRPDGTIFYSACVEESHQGEGDIYELETYIVGKGDYLAATILNWYDKTHEIKEVFEEMIQRRDADISCDCIEWYRSDYEMLCLVKQKELTTVQ